MNAGSAGGSKVTGTEGQVTEARVMCKFYCLLNVADSLKEKKTLPVNKIGNLL